jgi:hypothetical protein
MGYAARSEAAEGSDERIILEAMLKARFTLVSVEKVIPKVGVQAVDHIYGKAFLLADVGLSETARRGVVLATRLLPLRRFTMTTGAPLTFDPELAKWFLEGLGKGSEDIGSLASLPAKERKLLARHLIALALEDPGMVKVGWRGKVEDGGD